MKMVYHDWEGLEHGRGIGKKVSSQGVMTHGLMGGQVRQIERERDREREIDTHMYRERDIQTHTIYTSHMVGGVLGCGLKKSWHHWC